MPSIVAMRGETLKIHSLKDIGAVAQVGLVLVCKLTFLKLPLECQKGHFKNVQNENQKKTFSKEITIFYLIKIWFKNIEIIIKYATQNT